tara:strand:+ start:1728 stop:2480 length:753 start_codon:yes stop_codon:yes gene_type:complete
MTEFTAADMVLLIPLAAILLLLIVGHFREKTWKARMESGTDPAARLKSYNETMGLLWLTAIVATVCWVASGRSLDEMGFGMTHGSWRGGLAWGATVAATGYMIWAIVESSVSRKARSSARKQVDAMGGLESIRPRTTAEHNRFVALAITAGITEEVIFRGFLIMALAWVMPIWLAAILSIAAFTLGHLYQGMSGLIRVLPTALILTLVFLIGGSLWPVIIIHAALDLAGGGVFRVLDRHAEADAAAEPAT